jgi:hypothetical protein
VALATAVALFLTTPWTSSPGFLERAEAALTPPQDMILHAKLAETDCSGRWTAQIWVDEHTHRYRGLFHDPFLPYPFRYFTLEEIRAGLCNVRASTYEAGVVLGPRNVCCGRHNTLLHSFVPLRFVPPNKLIRFPGPGFARASANPTIFGTVPALDPVAELRRAIRSGLAHDQGRTTLNGRTVERIRIDPCPPKSAFTDPSPCTDLVWSSGGGYAYVDPETYYPVEIRLSVGGGADVIRFATYEYLPRTAANLALTNIRAQHPHARLTDR